MISRASLISSLTLLLAFFLSSGCATTTPHLTAVDSEAISAGRKSVVLLGLTADWNNKRVDPIDLLRLDDLSFGATLATADLERGGGLKRTRAFIASPSGSSGRRWMYLILSPGSYYVWGLPPPALRAVDIQVPLRDIEGFFLNVPPEHPVVYAGTVHLDCGGSRFLAERYFKRLRPSISDETEEAAEFAHKTFNEWPEMSVSLLRPYGTVDPNQQALFPAVLLTEGTSTVRSPDWKNRSLQKWIVPPPFSPATGGPGDGVLVMAYLAYLPIGYLLGSTRGEADARKWTPCMENLQAGVVNSDPARTLRQSLAKSLEDRVVLHESSQTTALNAERIAAQNSSATVLLADVRRIQLRECDSGLFAVEVAARARVWDSQKHSYVFDRTILYTNPQARPLAGEIESPSNYWITPLPFPQPYEIMLPTSSVARPLQDYCGSGGQEVFLEEINGAIESAVKEFVRDLGASKAE